MSQFTIKVKNVGTSQRLFSSVDLNGDVRDAAWHSGGVRRVRIWAQYFPFPCVFFTSLAAHLLHSWEYLFCIVTVMWCQMISGFQLPFSLICRFLYLWDAISIEVVWSISHDRPRVQYLWVFLSEYCINGVFMFAGIGSPYVIMSCGGQQARSRTGIGQVETRPTLFRNCS